MRILLVCLLAGCLNLPLPAVEDETKPGAGGDAGPDRDAAVLFAAFTMNGCAALEHTAAGPRCAGPAPLRVRFVPVSSGAEVHRWQVLTDGARDGGPGGAPPELDEEQRRQRSPRVTFPWPGRFVVTLAVAGSAGTASAVGTVVVQPAALGAACDEDGQCEPGLSCLCSPRRPGADGACPGALSAGLCARPCGGAAVPCPAGSACLDLSRSLLTGDGGGGDAWRHPICVPLCSGDVECRTGMACRELPLLPPGAQPGSLAWGRVCFAGEPQGVGGACPGPAPGTSDPAACATGLCEPLAARGLCTAACTGKAECPGDAACAHWNGAPGPPVPQGPRCLARCDDLHPCADPLLSCQAAGGSGALGFRLPGEPPAATVCAPRRCAGPADCRPGRCAALTGASFCVP